MFDAYGNYLYCSTCISNILHISNDRLARLCENKVRQYQEPVRVMTKKQVLNQKLEEYVLRPGLDPTQPDVTSWWKSLRNIDKVEVKYPHERHRLVGKPSKYWRLLYEVLSMWNFVDTNIYPNGRQAGSYTVFSSISPPSSPEMNHQSRARKIMTSRLIHQLLEFLILA